MSRLTTYTASSKNYFLEYRKVPYYVQFFTVFINDLILSLSTASLHNFAADNPISTFSKDL